MTTETLTPALTRDDLAALRAADGLSFHHLRPDDTNPSMIRAYLRSYGQQRIYTAREQVMFPATDTFDRSRIIAVASTVSGYDWPTGDPDWHRYARAFAMVGRNARTETMVSLLRPGVSVALHWQADNNNENHRQVGHHADELTMHITSPAGRHLTLLVAYQVGPDNTARMIRQHG